MPQVLWAMAILSHWTVVHRIYHTWRELKGIEEGARPEKENRASAAESVAAQR
jgi:hypothetical protein